MPAELETTSESTAIAKDINDYLNHYISVADAKAGALAAMAALTCGAPSLFVGESPMSSLQWAVKIAFSLHLVTLALCGMVVFPRKPSRGDSVIFWEDVASSPTILEYQERFSNAVKNKFFVREYISQNYYISRVLSRKYFWLRLAMLTYGVAVVAICLLLRWPLAGQS